MMEIKFIKIDLSNLYEVIRPKVAPWKILRDILEENGVEYEILVNISPDTGEVYLINDKEFEDKFSEALYIEDDAFEVLEEYAKKKNAKAIVELDDGYETAIALIYDYKDIEKEAKYLAERGI